MSYDHVLNFWFQELTPQQWFAKDTALDQEIARRFLTQYQSAIRGELFEWRREKRGRLAEILLLDQFSRNLFRDQPESFAADPVALVLAQEAVQQGVDQSFEVRERVFLYMPYMHSESLVIHQVAIKLFQQKGLEFNYDYELKHKNIIERFGRYPHRNAILGRTSTKAEVEFLQEPGSRF